MKIYLGIDPGLKGALAAVREDGCLLYVDDTPSAKVTRGNDYVVGAMVSLARVASIHGDVAAVGIELQGARPGEHRGSGVKIGRGQGIWEGIVAALGYGYQIVAAGSWKRTAAIASGSPKGASRLAASQRWPEQADLFARVRDDGRADAALIAYHVMRKETS